MIAGVVLAAGAGERFGAAKQLAELDGRPLLEHALDAMAAAAWTGSWWCSASRADEVSAGVDLHGAEPVVCESLERGPVGVAGLRAGHLEESLDGQRLEAVVVTLGDQPGPGHDAVRACSATRGATPAVRATYGGEPGHPVVLARSLLGDLRDATGDAGARARTAPSRGRRGSVRRPRAAAPTWTPPPNSPRCDPKGTA